ncbi:MAG: NADP oxidoreductase [Candidatus Omnitrophica bacterium]|nr:NADP oxidoreductase [Candidatus Omnitrophota bacterium]
MKRKTIATVWLGGCSGCHMSLLDIDERILEVAKLADILKSPIVDGKEFPEVDVALVEGSVTSDEHQHELEVIRQKSKILISLGDCAVTSNVTSMRNQFNKEDVLNYAYKEAISNDGQGQMPGGPWPLLHLIEKVVPLHEVVKVDYFIPGCPPSADTIFYVLFELLNDRIPDLSAERKLKYG